MNLTTLVLLDRRGFDDCVVSLLHGLLLAATCTPVQGPASAESVDSMLARCMAEHGIPGLAVIVLRDGEIVLERYRGLADVEAETPVGPTTLFQIASTTKVFGGVALSLLEQESEVRLDDPVARWVEGTPDTWSEVRIRHVLSHTSGLPDLWRAPDVPVSTDPGEVLRIVGAQPVSAAPGAEWRYNQLGYLLVGLVVRGATGQEFGAYCREKIFRPLGLDSAAFGGCDVEVRGRATYYEPDGSGKLRVYTGGIYPFAGIAPAAGLNLTARELARFDAALTKGELLGRESLARMWAPALLGSGQEARFHAGTMGYARGWSLIHYAGHTARGHDGGHTNAYYRFEPDGVSVIVLTNLVDPQGPPLWLLERVAALYIPDLENPYEVVGRFRAALEAGDLALASELGRSLTSEFPDNPLLTNDIAWRIVTSEAGAQRDLDLALDAARAAVAAEPKDPAILDTLARVLYERDELDEALSVLEHAIELAGDSPLAAQLRTTFQHYIDGDV